MNEDRTTWKRPQGPPEEVALPKEAIEWITLPADLRRVTYLNKIFDRIIVTYMRYRFYLALTQDQDLLRRTKSNRYNAPLNLIRRSLSTNIVIATCALHDKSKETFSTSRFIDRMFKDKFDERALAHHTNIGRITNTAANISLLRKYRASLDSPEWENDINYLRNMRHNILAHFSEVESNAISNDIDYAAPKAFIHSMRILFLVRAIFVGDYRDPKFEDWFENRTDDQAKNLVEMLRPPGAE